MESIRAHAWIAFATGAKHAVGPQQQAAVADELMIEFDKRAPYFAGPLNTALESKVENLLIDIAKLETAADESASELDARDGVIAKLEAERDAFAKILKTAAIGKETPRETLERLVR